ncbi:MAG TPA: anti-sigma factor [Nitrolancea sp.]|nr:anti-sigma factor [Nitrolancea sp.]
MQQEDGHRHVHDLIAPYVLGALEPDELEEVELHLLHCPACQALVDEERQVALLLPYLAPPREVPRRARRQLLGRLHDDEPAPAGSLASRIPIGVLRISWFAATVAAVLALIFAVHSYQMQNQITSQNNQLLTLEGQQETVVSFVAEHGGFATRLQDTGMGGSAQGAIIVDPNGNSAMMVVDGLTKPRPGHAYVVWVVRGQDHVKVGLLPVDNQGHAVLRIVLPEAVVSFDSIIVTDESGPAVAFPSGTHLLSAHVNP